MMIILPRFSVRRILLLVLALAVARCWPSVRGRTTATDGGGHHGDDLLSLQMCSRRGL
jgi:hypothetical protein